MSWVQVITDSFSRANTSTGSAGSTTGAGNNWTDVEGGIWNIQSDQLNGTTNNTNGFIVNFLLRPSSENHLAARIVTTLIVNTSMSLECNLRYQSASQNNYHLDVNFAGGHAAFFTRIGGSFTQIGATQTFGPSAGHTYTVDFAVTGTSPTTLAMTITDVTTSTVIVNNYTQTDSTSGLQVAGGYAITAGSPGGSNQTLIVTAVTTYTEDATFTVSPTTAVPGTPETITATGSGTSWVSGTTTFNVAGGSGASISGLSVNNSAQTATFTLQPGSAAGTLTISDSTDSATATVTVLTPSFTVSPTTATTGVNETITATGSDTSWTSGTTFSVSGGTGASISGISVNTSAQTATFTLHPGSSPGTLTISDSADSATASITASLPSVNISPTSTARIESPGYWVNAGGGRTGGSSRQTWRIGSWVKYFWSTSSGSPTCILNMSNATAGSEISFAINGTLTDGIVVPSSGGISLTSYLSGAGSYVLQVWYRNSALASRWNYSNALVDAGITVDGLSTPGTAPALRHWGLFVGDSITEGINSNGGSPDFITDYAFLLSQTLDQLGYDYGIDACGGRGYLLTGDSSIGGDVPAWYYVSGGVYNASLSGWNKIDGSNSLLDSNSQISAYGSTGTTPAIILINFGTNEAINTSSTSDLATAVQDALASLRAAAPSAQLRILLFFGAYTGGAGFYSAATAATYAAAIRNGVTNYLAANPGDTKTKLIDLGAIASTCLQEFTANNIHPQQQGHAFGAAAIAGYLGQALTAQAASAGVPSVIRSNSYNFIG